MTEPEYEIRRSARRTRTMSAFREGGRIVVAVPAGMPARRIPQVVPDLVARFLAQEERRAGPRGEEELTERLRVLYRRYLQPVAGGELPAMGARWVGNQQARWGSCTPATGEIRLSDRLRPFPAWVVDYVLVHEAAHLIERHHDARFHALVARYERTEQAIAFLEGYEFARTQGMPTD